jgi:hypothetical protein
MATAESAARRAIDDLGGLVKAASRPKVAAALAALNQFKTVHTQIVALSRRNSNVRSLALSLGQKRTLTAACEETARGLQEALAKRGFAATGEAGSRRPRGRFQALLSKPPKNSHDVWMPVHRARPQIVC